MSGITKIQSIQRLPGNISVGLGKILIVGGSRRDYPLFVREFEGYDFIFTDDQKIDWRRADKILKRTKCVIVSQSTPNPIAFKIGNHVPECAPIYRFSGTTEEFVKALFVAMPKARVPEEQLKMFIAAPQHKTPILPPIHSEGKSMQKEKRQRAGQGELSLFIKENANFDTDDINNEVQRLLKLSENLDFQTTRSSIYVTFFRLRKKNPENTKRPSSGEKTKIPQTPEIATREKREKTDSAQEAPLPAKIITTPKTSIESIASDVDDAEPMSSPPAPTPSTDTLKIPAEGRIAEGDKWFEPRESVRIIFYPNSNYRKEGAKWPKSKYIGFVNARDSLPVFPNEAVRMAIESEYEKQQEYPIELPCFIEIALSRTCWKAYSIDSDKFHKQEIQTEKNREIEIRLREVEALCFRLQLKLEKLQSTSVQEMLVVFDYQNFLASCSHHRKFPHITKVADDASKHRTPMPRRIVKIIIVDKNDERLRMNRLAWKENKDVEFFEVPTEEANPTDQYVWKATYDSINKLGFEKGGLVAIVSGDHHFVPLFRDLKDHGYETMIICDEKNAHEAVVGKADYVLNLF